MRKTFFLLYVGLFSNLLFPQSDVAFLSHHRIDSLQKLLSGSETDKDVEILNQLASFYAPLNFDSSVFYAVRAMRLATQNGNQKEIGIARYNLGNAYYYRLDFKNAMISYLAAQSILEKGNYTKELGDVNLMLGNINYFIRRSNKALLYYHKALGNYQSGKHEKSLFAVYDALSLAMYFLDSGPIDSTLKYGYKMLEQSRKFSNRYQESYSFMEIGMFCTIESRSPRIKKKALAYCDSALMLASALKEDLLTSIIHANLGSYYDRSTPLFEITGDLVISRTFYDKAYLFAKKAGCSYIQAAILNYLVTIDLEEKKYGLAGHHLNLCEDRLNFFFNYQWENTPAEGFLINSLGKIQDYFMAQRERMNMYGLRYNLAMAKGKTPEAINWLQLYYEYRDTLINSQQGQQIGLMIAEDETNKQQEKIETLAKDNELNQMQLSRTRIILVGIGAGIFFISMILLLVLQRRKLKAEQGLVSMEQRLLRAQMNPHFIFNSLASIQNFVINENTDKATIYLSKFSQLVRNILDNSTEEYIPLEKEVSTIENYLELQKVRYGGKFDFNISVDKKIDEENMLIPPMLAQPFIENAIEHGIRHKETSGHIEITFQLKDELILVEVEDDGVGREKAREMESTQTIRHRSMAISITRDRLDILNKKLKKKIRMEIIDLKDATGQGCGTKVVFGIPVVVR